MLEAPRALLDFALLPLKPPEPPPRAPELFEAPALLAPGLAPPPLLRFAVLALGLAPPPRFAVLALGLAPPPRFAEVALAPAADCRPAAPPFVEPPYLLAVAGFEYGAPPRWAELCCTLPLLMFAFLL